MLDFGFAEKLMEKLGIDNEAKNHFCKMAETLFAEPHRELTEKTVYLLRDKPSKYAEISSLCDAITLLSGYSQHSVTAFIFLAASEFLHEKFLKRGADEEIFLTTADDLRCKLIECREMYGVHGVFVREWLFSFFKIGRFGLGRMQFELCNWSQDPVIVGNHLLDVGMLYINFHIPSSGQPFDPSTRADAYKKAADFFAKNFETPFIPIVCRTWLLDPKHRLYLSESSNIRNFADDFHVVIGKKTDTFTNSWRIFGSASSLPIKDLPENTSMQRVYKKRLTQDDTFYNGTGILWMENPKL